MNLMIIVAEHVAEHINRKSALSLSNSKFPNTHLTLYSASYSMASSWITTPHLRPSPDAESSESHPTLLLSHNFKLHMASTQPESATPDAKLARERMGPFAVSAAQISVNIREDEPLSGLPTPTLPVALQSSITQRPGLPDLSNCFPSDAELSAQAAPTFERADVETTHLAGSLAMPQPSLSSSTFKPQVLSFSPTTDPQAISSISAAPNSSTMGSSHPAPPDPPLSPSTDPEREKSERPDAMRLSTGKTDGTGNTGNTIVQLEQRDIESLVNPGPFWYHVWAEILNRIILAGFLVLPSTFPDLESIAKNIGEDKGDVRKVLQQLRNPPLYVPSLLSPPFKLTCVI